MSKRIIRPAQWRGNLVTLDSSVWLPDLAREIYGARARLAASSLTAFAYAYRRFGPPPISTDDYKDLGGAWILTTRDRDIFLKINPGGWSIDLDLQSYVSERLRSEADLPGQSWREESRRRHDEMFPDGDWLLDSLQNQNEQPWLDGMQKYPGCPPEIDALVERALRHVLFDLLRPVYVRDVAINLFGPVSEVNPSRGAVAKRSPLAGWGVPIDEISKRIKRRLR